MLKPLALVLVHFSHTKVVLKPTAVKIQHQGQRQVQQQQAIACFLIINILGENDSTVLV